ncbi:MAG: hypothetical protein ACM3ME_00555 [Chloroflexota bacterium]
MSEENELTNKTLYNSQGDIELGNKLENPYTIENMNKAYDTLLSNGIISKVPFQIRPTHYYIKFSPKNINEYNSLKDNNKLLLFDYPLDYEIITQGNRYHDKTLPDSVPTYQYSVIKDTTLLPSSVKWSLLSALYIPEEDTSLLQADMSNLDYATKLLDQVYIQTHNYQDTIKNIDNGKSSSYHPHGQILIFDTRLNKTIGLEGLQVYARRWFTVTGARPDFDGNYYMKGTFNRPCNYSLYFDTEDFEIREHFFGLTHWINGPKISGAWNHTIENGYDRFTGHVFRGAYRYHYKYIDGLGRPSRPSGERTIYIAKDCQKNWSGVNWIVFPVIKIPRYGSNAQEYDSDEIFSTTIHETAHTSHVIVMNAGVIQYSQVSSLIQESWPVAVEWWLTKLEYKNTRGIINYGDYDYSVDVQYPNKYAYQYWNKSFSTDYTTLFINLIDNHNELNNQYGNKLGSVEDLVYNYTLSGIEQKILKHSYGNSSLSTQLKNNKPSNVTDAQIDILMRYY